VVISFSAGNNGPGLGSMNRNLIYPKDVLVNGAYLSRDLAYRLNGTLGIPEEGRIMYRSSFGPGADFGPGANVSSPLVSLVHDTPDRGLRTFSGTSSASAAMTGLAAVLISAIKQKNLKVDASSVVHALRMSGKMIPETPFVLQGHGVPQIDKAFDLYQKLIAGKVFKDINIKVIHKRLTPKRGIFLKTSRDQGSIQYTVKVHGELSPLAPAMANELFYSTRVEYSHPWIRGPKLHYLSTSSSYFYTQVDLEKINWDRTDEVFGSIKIFNEKNNKIVQIIPVTVINDRVLNKSISKSFSLFTDQGGRVNFNIPHGVYGIIVQLKNHTNIEGQKIGFNLYNQSGVKGALYYPEDYESTFLKVSGPGLYNLGVFLRRGVEGKANFSVQIKPVQLENQTLAISAKDPSISIFNHGEIIEGEIFLETTALILKKKLVPFKGSGFFKIDTKFDPQAQSHFVDLFPATRPDFSYLRYFCYHKVYNREGKLLYFNSGRELIKNKKTKTGDQVEFDCAIFDSFNEKLNRPIEFVFQALKRPDLKMPKKFVRLIPGHNLIDMNNFSASGRVNILLRSPFQAGEEMHIDHVDVF
jgi:hypothetical protein